MQLRNYDDHLKKLLHTNLSIKANIGPCSVEFGLLLHIHMYHGL